MRPERSPRDSPRGPYSDTGGMLREAGSLRTEDDDHPSTPPDRLIGRSRALAAASDMAVPPDAAAHDSGGLAPPHTRNFEGDSDRAAGDGDPLPSLYQRLGEPQDQPNLYRTRAGEYDVIIGDEELDALEGLLRRGRRGPAGGEQHRAGVGARDRPRRRKRHLPGVDSDSDAGEDAGRSAPGGTEGGQQRAGPSPLEQARSFRVSESGAANLGADHAGDGASLGVEGGEEEAVRMEMDGFGFTDEPEAMLALVDGLSLAPGGGLGDDPDAGLAVADPAVGDRAPEGDAIAGPTPRVSPQSVHSAADRPVLQDELAELLERSPHHAAGRGHPTEGAGVDGRRGPSASHASSPSSSSTASSAASSRPAAPEPSAEVEDESRQLSASAEGAAAPKKRRKRAPPRRPMVLDAAIELPQEAFNDLVNVESGASERARAHQRVLALTCSATGRVRKHVARDAASARLASGSAELADAAMGASSAVSGRGRRRRARGRGGDGPSGGDAEPAPPVKPNAQLARATCHGYQGIAADIRGALQPQPKPSEAAFAARLDHALGMNVDGSGARRASATLGKRMRSALSLHPTASLDGAVEALRTFPTALRQADVDGSLMRAWVAQLAMPLAKRVRQAAGEHAVALGRGSPEPEEAAGGADAGTVAIGRPTAASGHADGAASASMAFAEAAVASMESMDATERESGYASGEGEGPPTPPLAAPVILGGSDVADNEAELDEQERFRDAAAGEEDAGRADGYARLLSRGASDGSSSAGGHGAGAERLRARRSAGRQMARFAFDEERFEMANFLVEDEEEAGRMRRASAVDSATGSAKGRSSLGSAGDPSSAAEAADEAAVEEEQDMVVGGEAADAFEFELSVEGFSQARVRMSDVFESSPGGGDAARPAVEPAEGRARAGEASPGAAEDAVREREDSSSEASLERALAKSMSGSGGSRGTSGRRRSLSASYGVGTLRLMDFLSEMLPIEGASIDFCDDFLKRQLTQRKTRASAFGHLLILVSDRRLQLTQRRPYGELIVGRGDAFSYAMDEVPGAAAAIPEEAVVPEDEDEDEDEDAEMVEAQEGEQEEGEEAPGGADDEERGGLGDRGSAEAMESDDELADDVLLVESRVVSPGLGVTMAATSEAHLQAGSMAAASEAREQMHDALKPGTEI